MEFSQSFQQQLKQLFLWRRDVRRFKKTALAEEKVVDLLRQAILAPSVGYSQPWRFVQVESSELKDKAIAEYKRAKAEAGAMYKNEQAKIYSQLKLSGMQEAPVHLAVFADQASEQGAGLGQQTMPETLNYSVATAIENLWLAARAQGIGVGWVSILDPDRITEMLAVSDSWQLIAYLCLGYPEEEHLDPELVRANWAKTLDLTEIYQKK